MKTIMTMLILSMISLVLPAQSGVEFRDVRLRTGEEDGVKGIGYTGYIYVDRQTYTGRMLGIQLRYMIRDVESQRVLLDTNFQVSLSYRSNRIIFNDADKEGFRSINTFRPISTLDHLPGKRKVSCRLQLYETFMDDKDTLATTDWQETEIDFPERKSVFFRLWNFRPVAGGDSSLFLKSGYIFLEQDQDRVSTEDSVLFGYLDLSAQDRLRVGSFGIGQGRGGGFRLFGIQIFRGRKYTYLDDIGWAELNANEILEKELFSEEVALLEESGKKPYANLNLEFYSQKAFLDHFVAFNHTDSLIPQIVESPSGPEGKAGEKSFEFRMGFECKSDSLPGPEIRYQFLLTAGEEIWYSSGNLWSACKGSEPYSEVAERSRALMEALERDLRPKRMENRLPRRIVPFKESKGETQSDLLVSFPFEELTLFRGKLDTADLPLRATFMITSSEVSSENAGVIYRLDRRLPWEPLLQYQEEMHRKAVIRWVLILGGIALVLGVGIYLLVDYRKKNRVELSDIQIGDPL